MYESYPNNYAERRQHWSKKYCGDVNNLYMYDVTIRRFMYIVYQLHILLEDRVFWFFESLTRISEKCIKRLLSLVGDLVI